MRYHIGSGSTAQAAADAGAGIPMPAETSDEVRFLDPESVTLRRTGSLLEMEGPEEGEWRQVRFCHLYPLSEPEAWLSVLDKDGKEIGILQSLRGMAEDSLALAIAELHRRYVVPRILRVLGLRERFDLLQWKLETDRGVVVVLTRNLREQSQQAIPNRFSITDVEGNRYDVDLATLDPISRAALEARL